MAQKGHDSRKSNVMAGEQTRRDGPGSHKNFYGQQVKDKTKGEYNCSADGEKVELL
jgi:hypothetical protein